MLNYFELCIANSMDPFLFFNAFFLGCTVMNISAVLFHSESNPEVKPVENALHVTVTVISFICMD